MRRFAALAAIGCVLAVLAMQAAAAAADAPQLTQVGRLPFPERAFVVDLPHPVPQAKLGITVSENGVPVPNVRVTPAAGSQITFGAVLALDASDSMRGRPYADAVAAARTFVARRNPNQQVGVVTFNDTLDVRQPPTSDAAPLERALSRPPATAYGTRIYDAVARSLQLLEDAQIASGSVVLISDGADVGSTASLDSVVRRARHDHVRVFSVGLRSKAFDAYSLEQLATQTGGSYAEASASARLAGIYASLSGRLSNEYVVAYRSGAQRGDKVNVAVGVTGLPRATASYVAGGSSTLAPFHRSLLSRFVLSPASVVLLGLVGAALAALVLLSVLRRPRTTVLDRVGAFVGVVEAPTPRVRTRRRLRTKDRAQPALRLRLERTLEIARIDVSAMTVIWGTSGLTVVSLLVLAAISPPLALLALLVPVAVRALVTRRLRAVRSAFAEQLPDTLQVLASALRTGHSFLGALAVVVDNAPDPARREFRQVLTDDQLGVLPEESLQRVAVRMANNEMRQVALLAALQRTAGGNSAEVLDTVVETVRERAEVRRLARTLTAQGRMARWILTFLPPVIGLFMLATHADLMRPLYATGGGQTALAIAAAMLAVGSLWIGRIVEIET